MLLLLLGEATFSRALAADSGWVRPDSAREAWVLCRQASVSILDEPAVSPESVADAVLRRCSPLFDDAAVESLAALLLPYDADAVNRSWLRIAPDVRADVIADVLLNRSPKPPESIDQSPEGLYQMANMILNASGDVLDVSGEATLRYAAMLGHRQARCHLAHVYVLHGLEDGVREKMRFYTSRSMDLLLREIREESPCAARTLRLIREGAKAG